MARKFGFGILGAGMAIKPHLKSLQDLRETIEICGLYARDPQNRRDYCLANGIDEFESYEAMLDDPAVDAILMLTPANARLELVKKAVKAGKHILMEKPVERTTRVATEIVEICERSNVRLGLVFQHRFRASSLALNKLVSQGELGPLASAFLVVPWWREQAYYEELGRGTLERDGGGVLMTQAIHAMDLMLSLTGPVAEVQGIAGTSSMHDMETEDFVGAGLRFASGALGSITATVNNFPGEQEYIGFNFEKGTARLAGGVLDVHWQDGRVEQFGEPAKTGGGGDPMDFPYEWHMAQISEFVDAVKAGRDPVSNGRTALHVHRLIDAIMQSSATGKRVRVSAQ